MVFILTSILPTHYYDADGIKRPTAITDRNGFLSAMRRYIKKYDRLVYIANYPHDPDGNDIGIAPAFRGFELTGMDFKEKIILDDRNKENARTLLSDADLIVLGGGKVVCELEFLREIDFKNIVHRHDGLTIGTSAGAMNLCETIANFPEEESDLGQELWLSGMGFSRRVIIPHFDGEAVCYQLPCDGIDVVKDYVLPMSKNREFVGIPNGSFIIVDGDKEMFCGDVYSIKNGKVKKIHG